MFFEILESFQRMTTRLAIEKLSHRGLELCKNANNDSIHYFYKLTINWALIENDAPAEPYTKRSKPFL